MAVIIGAGTTLTANLSTGGSLFPSGGILSLSFGFEPQVERLWQLGDFRPYDTFVQRQRNIQISSYGTRADGTGGSTRMTITPATTCNDADSVEITVIPASCLGSIAPFRETYFVTSYGYEKDNVGYGQESWSFQSKPIFDSYTGTIRMLRGIPEGTLLAGEGAMTPGQMGVEVDEVGSNDRSGSPIQGESGSVSAGTPGIGQYEFQRYVLATAVGGSVGISAATDGLRGSASISIPITPVFL